MKGSETPALPLGRVGLAVAHPGHELRLARWLELQRPTVFVLTSGSRDGADRTRVTASRALIQALGGRPGGLFGDHLDREVYGWIIGGETRRFAALARRLADLFVEAQLDTVVADGWQLYNVTHDLWHLTTRVAARLAGKRLGREIACLDFAVVPRALAERDLGPAELVVRLTPAEAGRKLELAEAYPAIARDLQEVLAAGGETFLGEEALHRLRPMAELLPGSGEVPAYERFGEARVKAGLYAEVLRWRHAAPAAAALLDLLGEGETAA